MSSERILQPTIIVTEGYLNDPIKFQPDSRFVPQSALRLIESQSIAERDVDGFIFVNTNTQMAQHYPVEMILTVYDRADFERVIDREFRQINQE